MMCEMEDGTKAERNDDGGGGIHPTMIPTRRIVVCRNRVD
jgi:hypothetical protein